MPGRKSDGLFRPVPKEKPPPHGRKKPPSHRQFDTVSENTKHILDHIDQATDQASSSDTPPTTMRAMMASLKRSLDNDRAKHIYNAGVYADSLAEHELSEWEHEESEDETGN